MGSLASVFASQNDENLWISHEKNEEVVVTWLRTYDIIITLLISNYNYANHRMMWFLRKVRRFYFSLQHISPSPTPYINMENDFKIPRKWIAPREMENHVVVLLRSTKHAEGKVNFETSFSTRFCHTASRRCDWKKPFHSCCQFTFPSYFLLCLSLCVLFHPRGFYTRFLF